MWKSWHSRMKSMLGRMPHVELAALVEETVRHNENLPDYHVSRGQVNHWLNGRRHPRLFEFFALCQVVGADPGEVLFGQRVLQNHVQPSTIAARVLASHVTAEPHAVYQHESKVRSFKAKKRRVRRLISR